MPIAYYMIFKLGHHGSIDRTGGLPTHLQKTYPICQDCGNPRVFGAQFYSEGDRLRVKGIGIQLYLCHSCLNVPIVEIIPFDAQRNVNNMGTISPYVKSYDIEWQTKEDPAYPGLDIEFAWMSRAKIGGTPYFIEDIDSTDRFVLQIKNYPAEFGFGLSTLLVLEIDGKYVCRLV